MESKKIPKNPLIEKITKKKRMKFLVISDIHMTFNKLDKLKNWYFNINDEQFDYILCPGDFENLTEKRRDPKVCKEAEIQIASVLSYIEFISVPVLYVPGNHDPITLFEAKQQNEKSELEHKSLT